MLLRKNACAEVVEGNRVRYLHSPGRNEIRGTSSCHFGTLRSRAHSMSHAYLGAQAIMGQYGHTTLASSASLERQQKDGQCVAPSTFTHAKSETAEAREAQLSRFLIAHHKKMLARDPTQARQSCYFRFHHHPSNPFLYAAFNALSLETVVGYQQVIESVCHSMNGGHVEKKVVARDTEYVSVL